MFKELNVPILILYINNSIVVPAADVSKYITAKISSFKYEYVGENSDFIETVKVWYYVPCSQVIANGIPKEKLIPPGSGYLEDVIVTQAFCANMMPGDTLSVQGEATDKVYELLSFDISPCSLAVGCATADEVDELGFTFSRGMKSMNLSNFENPITYKMSGDDFIYLNTASTQIYREFLLENKIVDDRGFMIGKKDRETYFTADRYFTNQKARSSSNVQCTAQSCKSYFKYIYHSGPGQQTITRSYKGWLETFGDIGGVAELLFLFFSVIYSTWNHRQLKKYMAW